MRRWFTGVSLVVAATLTLACSGIWGKALSQASVDNLTEARAKVEACTGDGRDDALTAADDAIVIGLRGDIGFSELVFIQTAFDEASADGEISVTEASTLRTRVDDLSTP